MVFTVCGVVLANRNATQPQQRIGKLFRPLPGPKSFFLFFFFSVREAQNCLRRGRFSSQKATIIAGNGSAKCWCCYFTLPKPQLCKNCTKVLLLFLLLSKYANLSLYTTKNWKVLRYPTRFFSFYLKFYILNIFKLEVKQYSFRNILKFSFVIRLNKCKCIVMHNNMVYECIQNGSALFKMASVIEVGSLCMKMHSNPPPSLRSHPLSLESVRVCPLVCVCVTRAISQLLLGLPGIFRVVGGLGDWCD